MVPAHRTELILTEDGKLALERLPFRAGQSVEVIVLAKPFELRDPTTPTSMRGAVTRYDRPTDPVADDDWGVLQ